MADETQYNDGGEKLDANGLPDGSPEATGGYAGPTEKVVVERKPVDKKELDPITDPATSALPYHTANTEKIQADRGKELEGKEKQPYEYHFNGYTVTEVEQPNPQATEEKFANTMWIVKADDADFEQAFNNKRAAEIFVETHSPQFAKNAAIKHPTAQQDAPQV